MKDKEIQTPLRSKITWRTSLVMPGKSFLSFSLNEAQLLICSAKKQGSLQRGSLFLNYWEAHSFFFKALLFSYGYFLFVINYFFPQNLSGRFLRDYFPRFFQERLVYILSLYPTVHFLTFKDPFFCTQFLNNFQRYWFELFWVIFGMQKIGFLFEKEYVIFF